MFKFAVNNRKPEIRDAAGKPRKWRRHMDWFDASGDYAQAFAEPIAQASGRQYLEDARVISGTSGSR